jgi:hypothetical protein
MVRDEEFGEFPEGGAASVEVIPDREHDHDAFRPARRRSGDGLDEGVPFIALGAERKHLLELIHRDN